MSKKNSLNLIEHARPRGVISPNKQNIIAVWFPVFDQYTSS